MRILKQKDGWKEGRKARLQHEHLSICNCSLLQLASDPSDMTGFTADPRRELLWGSALKGPQQRESLEEVGKWASAQQASQEELIPTISDMCCDGKCNGAPRLV